MITELGKHLRKIRIDHGEILKNMADKLGVTSSFLSAVEIGKRNIPDGWIDNISQWYNLDQSETQALKEEADLAVTSTKINLINAGSKQRNAALIFARNFGDLSDEEAQVILNIFKGRS